MLEFTVRLIESNTESCGPVRVYRCTKKQTNKQTNKSTFKTMGSSLCDNIESSMLLCC